MLVGCGVTLACSDPTFNTDLDSEGPPEITIVTILSESVGEVPTFCVDGQGIKINADLCPEHEEHPGMRSVAPVMDAQPIGWYARIVFSELLDPSIERLAQEDCNGSPCTVGHLDESQPVTLTCNGVDLAYDGFYDPSGNDVTFPPGPALVITTEGQVAASGSSNCTLTVKDSVTDKDGNSVGDTKLMGPHAFGIAAMSAVASSPADTAEGVDPSFVDDSGEEPIQGGPAIGFNAFIDVSSVGSQISFVDSTGNTVAYTPTDMGTTLELTLDGPLAYETAYTITVPATNSITDIKGGALQIASDFTFTFTTGSAAQ